MYTEITELTGKILTSILVTPDRDEIIFTTNASERYKMYHNQDCCEDVCVEEIIGELDDLIGSPLLMAEEVSSENPYEPSADSYTWTFYKFATIKGYVTIRWLGISNGYYSEGVSFCKEI